MSTGPSYKTKDSQAAWDGIWDKDPFCVPQIKGLVVDQKPTPEWVISEIVRAFHIGFQEGRRLSPKVDGIDDSVPQEQTRR